MRTSKFQRLINFLWHYTVLGLTLILIFAILILGAMLINDLNLVSSIIIAIMVVFSILLWLETR